MICKNRRCQAEIEDSFLFCPHCGRKQEAAPKRKSKRPNGTGSVYKKSGSRSHPWVAARNNKAISYHATKAEALIALEKMAGKPISESVNYTFTEVYNGWLAEHKNTVTKKGVEGYNTAYNWCKPLYERKFRGLRTSDYQDVISAIIDAGKSRSLALKVKQLAVQLYKWAMREDICFKNYAEYITLPDEEDKTKAVFTEEQIAAIEAEGSETARVVLMLIYTGVRINELLSADIENYHGTYYITGSKTKAGKNRVVPIPPPARPHFEYFATDAKDKLLDAYTGNKAPDNFRKREFMPLMEKLGIEGMTPHCTRHTYASRAVAAGMRPEVLQKILGHANYSTTANIYVHSDAEELVAAVEATWQ